MVGNVSKAKAGLVNKIEEEEAVGPSFLFVLCLGPLNTTCVPALF